MNLYFKGNNYYNEFEDTSNKTVNIKNKYSSDGPQTLQCM